MKLYGAEISQQYIQYNDKKKRHIRYPNSTSYPREAAEQERWSNDKREVQGYTYLRGKA